MIVAAALLLIFTNSCFVVSQTTWDYIFKKYIFNITNYKRFKIYDQVSIRP